MKKNKIIATAVAALLVVIQYCTYYIGSVPFLAMALIASSIGYADIGYIIYKFLENRSLSKNKKGG